MRRHLLLLALVGSACLLATLHTGAQNPQNAIAGGAEIRQGVRVSAVRAQQEDLFVNPGTLGSSKARYCGAAQNSRHT